MNDCPFIDTNILLRHLLGDHATQSPSSTGLFDELAEGTRRARMSATVVFEAVYILASQYKLERAEIALALADVVSMTAIELPDREAVLDACRLYVRHPSLSFADCLHATLSIAYCQGEIFTFDRKFGQVAGVVRLEPGT